ncbi:unnamed protein product [Caenorhabditis angaria]|uniref:Centrosomal protein CEP104 N-terminal domain-containing protein n=1 Tax=Caenorhabditis angaria TaxID=860376 RepID=A0A9P1IFE3_9PELO|nr:unnamed protein product [Caenorhabditis angaria]
MPLPFTLISTSSSDPKFLAEKFSAENFSDENNINWRSEKNRSFPQSLILELDEESLVSSVTIKVDPDFSPSSLTVSLGIPSNHFRNSRGKSYNADYSQRREISFRDPNSPTTVATVFFHAPAKFIRVSIHGFVHSELNRYRQVGILSIEISGAGEIPAIESLKGAEEEQEGTAKMNYGLLLPLKNKMPTQKSKNLIHLYESDSDDEEILFSREMVDRLRKKEEHYSNLLPSVDTSQASTSSTKSLSPPISEKHQQQQILAEIAGPAQKNLELQFSARMAEFNNLERILARKREAAIFEQKYALASEVDKVLLDLKSRRTGLQELIAEREAALAENNLPQAEIARIRFDRNMSDALHSDEVLNVLDGADLARLGIS